MSHPPYSIEHPFVSIVQLLEQEIHPTDCRDAIRLARQLEAIGRRVDAARAELISAIADRGLHQAEASRRARAARAMRDLPELKEAWQAGEIGTCQIQRLARAHTNPRVRDKLVEAQSWFLEQACRQSNVEFDRLVTRWVDMVDEDGTADTNQRTHEERSARIVQEFDKSWRFDGGCAALQGAEMKAIFDHFVEAEFYTDWAEAKERHGIEATVEHLSHPPPAALRRTLRDIPASRQLRPRQHLILDRHQRVDRSADVRTAIGVALSMASRSILPKWPPPLWSIMYAGSWSDPTVWLSTWAVSNACSPDLPNSP